jgi:hypothetical protein
VICAVENGVLSSIDRLTWKTTGSTVLLGLVGGGSMDMLRWAVDDKEW